MMQAVRIHPDPTEPYSVARPAPTTSLHLDSVAVPEPQNQSELLVRIKATTVIRDSLTWPEMLSPRYQVPGHDFSGVVESTFDNQCSFKPDDRVFGMIEAARDGGWAKYAVVKVDELALKPESLSWEEAAAVPLSALTAWQALFRKAGLSLPSPGGGDEPAVERKARPKVLVTGAASGVGIYLVQFAALAGCDVTGATSSNERNASFLRSLGAGAAVEYTNLDSTMDFNVIVDTTGGEVLRDCWEFAGDNATLVTIDSASWDFVEEHRKLGIARDTVKALFFIVEPSSKDLESIAKALEQGHVETFVSATFRLAAAQKAYKAAHDRSLGRGKVMLTL